MAPRIAKLLGPRTVRLLAVAAAGLVAAVAVAAGLRVRAERLQEERARWVAAVRDLSAEGRHQEALARIDGLLADRPADADGRALRVELLEAAGRDREACAESRALLANGDRPAADWRRGVAVCRRAGAPEAARSLVEQALSRSALRPRLLLEAAELRLEQDRVDEAIALLQELMRYGDRHAAAHRLLGETLIRTGRDSAGGREHLAVARSIEPARSAARPPSPAGRARL